MHVTPSDPTGVTATHLAIEGGSLYIASSRLAGVAPSAETIHLLTRPAAGSKIPPERACAHYCWRHWMINIYPELYLAGLVDFASSSLYEYIYVCVVHAHTHSQ
jgi:hypothetical protein